MFVLLKSFFIKVKLRWKTYEVDFPEVLHPQKVPIINSPFSSAYLEIESEYANVRYLKALYKNTGFIF